MPLIHKPIGLTKIKEYLFRKILPGSGYLVVSLVLGIFVTLLFQSLLSIKHTGLSFLFGTTWDPVRELFGAGPFFTGTLITAILALFLSV
ncbi:MAG: phosphate transport system permease protein, partial [Candidatus Marinamargulisbacteria bacterium]